ncbi:MAG: DUF2231 domain-containing protein [Acidobacteriia bacterium]|nr:DUF2231 domain-containing protein [Terriglobia bacterium]
MHFPIALSLVAVLLELLARNRRARGLEAGGAALMVLAALGSVAAVLTGNLAHDEAVVPAAASALVARHEEVGEIAMWLLLALAAVRIALAWKGWFKGSVAWIYLAGAAVAAGVVGYNGYLGGKMVFDHGLGTAPVQRRSAPTGGAPSGAASLTAPGLAVMRGAALQSRG